MDLHSLFSDATFTWVVLPLLIFLARVIDVTIGTIRIIYVAKGMKILAGICGFFEVLIWLIAITQIMQNLSNCLMYIAYAGGFAMGNYVGIALENKIAMGHLVVNVITQRDATKLINHLRDEEFGVTSVAARGTKGKVRIIFTIIKRRDLEEVVWIIKQYNPNAFYSVGDIKAVKEGFFPMHQKREMASIRSVKKIK